MGRQTSLRTGHAFRDPKEVSRKALQASGRPLQAEHTSGAGLDRGCPEQGEQGQSEQMRLARWKKGQILGVCSPP